jgi:hypothetical protein
MELNHGKILDTHEKGTDMKFTNVQLDKIARLQAQSLVDHKALLQLVENNGGIYSVITGDKTKITVTRIGSALITTYDAHSVSNTPFLRQIVIYNPHQARPFIGSADIDFSTSKETLKNIKKMEKEQTAIGLEFMGYCIKKGLKGIRNPPEVIRIRSKDWLTKISKSRWGDLDWKKYLRETKQTKGLKRRRKVFNPNLIYPGDTFEIIQGRPTSGTRWV